MVRVEYWPPPDWPEVVITWETMLECSDRRPNMIIDWLACTPGGSYHLHGYQSTDGFAFRFEREEDATFFALKWTTI